MSRGWTYKSGDWNLLCDSCARKIKASESKQRWDGFRVCSDCFEPRHSMDFIRARADKISVPYTRPQPTDTFVSVTYADTGDSGIPSPSFVTYYVEENYVDADYFETGSTL